MDWDTFISGLKMLTKGLEKEEDVEASALGASLLLEPVLPDDPEKLAVIANLAKNELAWKFLQRLVLLSLKRKGVEGVE